MTQIDEVDLITELRSYRGKDWTVAAWLLERAAPQRWGTWHQECRLDAPPPAPVSIRNRAAAPVARHLVAANPDWEPRCQVCGGLLSDPPNAGS